MRRSAQIYATLYCSSRQIALISPDLWVKFEVHMLCSARAQIDKKKDSALATFLDRLRDSGLTDAGHYRRMKKSLESSRKQSSTTAGEEWKEWELTPVVTGRYSDGQKSRSSSKDASVLQKALLILES